MFVLATLTKVKVLDVRVLSQKDRKPDEQPGAQLLLQATLGIGVLSMFDGFLPGMLYRKATDPKSQGEIEGLESSELTSLGEHVKRLPWVYEQTGCQIVIDLGMGGKSNIVLEDVKVHRLSLRPEQNGVIIQWTADAPGLSDTTRGKLTGLKSTEIQMTLDGPEVDDVQADLDDAPPARTPSNVKPIDGTGKGWPFPKGGVDAEGNAKDATQTFVDAHGAH
jgi:hypothetical protein